MRCILAKISSFVLILAMVFSLAACGKKEQKTVTLSAENLTVAVGESKDLTAATSPADLIVSWSSSDPAIAVYANGKVTGVAPGTATVTAASGDVSGACRVTVTATPVEKIIRLSSSTLTMEAGTVKVLTATTTPADLAVNWSSSNPAVATYADGKVTALAEGSATITAANGDVSASCAVTVTKKPELVENEINKTEVMDSEWKEISAQDFAADAGIFSLSAKASYNSEQQAIDLSDQGYMYVKITMPEFSARYDYGDKAERVGFEGNARRFLRFEAKGSGGVEVYAINEDLEMVSILDPVILSSQEGKYQVEIPAMFSRLVAGVVLKNPAPADSDTTTTITGFDLKEELDPADRAVYLADMFAWMAAVDKGNEPVTFSPATGWNGWSGLSRGDLSGNCIAYLDSFGAALEYDNRDDKGQPGDNLKNDGVAIFGKIRIPQNAKKMTYRIGHVGDPSAYRIQLFDGTDTVELTESSGKVNGANVAADQGWKLTAQDYNGPETYEVAIPSKYAGGEVIIIFSAKYNNGSSFGMRINNVAFSSADIVLPPAMNEGVDINEVDRMQTTTSSTYDFSVDNQGFTTLWGATHANSAMEFTGAVRPEGAVADAAIAAKLTVPQFRYLRLTAKGESGKSADIRLRMLDFESKASSVILGWTAITGAEDQIFQIQSFPTTFVGTVGLVVEVRYADFDSKAKLSVSKIDFAATDRGEDGYDFTAMQYVPYQSMPADNMLTFGGENFAKWSVFTANDDPNTKGMANEPWMQLQATDATGAFSALAAYRTTLTGVTSLELKTGNIGGGVSKIRVRAMKTDGTFVNFVTSGLTDENGWYDAGNGNLINDYGWGKLFTNSLTVPAGLSGEEVLLMIEYDRKISVNWNVLLEHLLFS